MDFCPKLSSSNTEIKQNMKRHGNKAKKMKRHGNKTKYETTYKFTSVLTV